MGNHVVATTVTGAVLGGIGGYVASGITGPGLNPEASRRLTGAGVGAAVNGAYFGGVAYLANHSRVNPLVLGAAGAATGAALSMLSLSRQHNPPSSMVAPVLISALLYGGITYAIAAINRPTGSGHRVVTAPAAPRLARAA